MRRHDARLRRIEKRLGSLRREKDAEELASLLRLDGFNARASPNLGVTIVCDLEEQAAIDARLDALADCGFRDVLVVIVKKLRERAERCVQ